MSRSLAACTRCRRLKVRCSGPSDGSPCVRCQGTGANAQCTFLQPRQAHSVLPSQSELNQHDQIDRIEKLEKQIAELADISSGAMNELRRDIEGLNARVGKLQPPEPLKGSESSSILSEKCPLASGQGINLIKAYKVANIVDKGIITQSQCAELFKFFSQHCNDTISFLDSVDPSLENVGKMPILLAAVCSVGAKASGSSLYEACKQETQYLIQQTMFGDAPSIEAIKGILFHVGWNRAVRTLGHLVALSYESGLHKIAENLSSNEVAMAEKDVDMARTWLICCCFDLVMNMSGTALISNHERYTKLGEFLCASPHARKCDYRIKAYIELFGMAEEVKSFRFDVSCSNPLSDEAAVALRLLSTKVDSWYERTKSEKETLNQSYSKAQDRNRMIIPCAGMVMYINGLAIHNAPLNSELHPSHYPFVQAAIEAAITVLKTGVESKNYQRNLRFAIGYNSNGLYLAINFLYKSALMIHRDIAVDSIVDIFRQVTQMLSSAGVLDHAESLREKTEYLSQISLNSPLSRINQVTELERTGFGNEDDAMGNITWDQFPLFEGFSYEYPEGIFMTPNELLWL